MPNYNENGCCYWTAGLQRRQHRCQDKTPEAHNGKSVVSLLPVMLGLGPGLNANFFGLGLGLGVLTVGLASSGLINVTGCYRRSSAWNRVNCWWRQFAGTPLKFFHIANVRSGQSNDMPIQPIFPWACATNTRSIYRVGQKTGATLHSPEYLHCVSKNFTPSLFVL